MNSLAGSVHVLNRSAMAEHTQSSKSHLTNWGQLSPEEWSDLPTWFTPPQPQTRFYSR